MRWEPKDGYDAIRDDGQTFEVKTRKSWSTKCVNPSGRMGRFGRKGQYEFDQGVLVELDENFEVGHILELSSEEIRALEEKEPGSRGLHVGDFRRKGKQVYP